MFKEAEVDKAIALSTAHVPTVDTGLLEQERYPCIAVGEHNWVVSLWAEPEGLREAGFSKEFAEMYGLLKKEGFRYIVFDTDGNVVPELPEYEW